MQVVVPLVFVQVAPQPPQLPTSDLVLTSQPSRSLLPLQSAKPVAQVPLQAPLPQVTVSMLSLSRRYRSRRSWWRWC